MTLPDASDTEPLRRMAVVRGTTPMPQAPSADQMAVARATAARTAKDAAVALAHLHPFHVTHAELELAWKDGVLEGTFTLQALARTSLVSAALHALSTGLLEAAGHHAQQVHTELVQEVVA
jgi:molybdenum cofactor biosynthesis enzyme